MNDLNRATIMGNLTRDPELRQTSIGRPVCSFGVATNRRWTNADGEPQEQVEFHDVVAWGKLAEICSQILYKGRKAYIEGRLQTRTWEGQDGVKRNKTEIVADNVIALGPRRDAIQQGVDTTPAEDFDQRPAGEKPKTSKAQKPAKKSEAEQKSTPKKNPPAGGDEKEEEIDLDDIPF